MLFYDFEVFKYDWLVVIKDTDTKKTHTIVNDPEALKTIYEANINNIWCGYNSRNYDVYILKSILLGFNPKEVNDFIIVKKHKGWEFTNLFNQIHLINYDVMTTLHGLKQLEGFMGNNIKESDISFNIDRKLREDEIEETIKYCTHDVEQTIEVFLNRLDDFKAHMDLIKTFNLPITYLNKTKAQLTSIILNAKKRKHNDEFNIKILDSIKLNTFEFVKRFYENTVNRDYKKSLDVMILGVPHTFGWGGLHGAKLNYIDEGIFINSDVGSFYPSLMIIYDFLSRNVKNKSKYKDIYDYRMKLKHEGKKKEQQPYKIVLNATYGASKDKYNALYDPLQANNVCINGQLMLLDLIEKISEGIPGAMLIQSNTDGVMWKLPKQEDIKIYKAICNEWETRTKMTLEHDLIKKVIQKDVNNYYIVMNDGKVKSKGAYAKELNLLDNNLPIINAALKNYFLDNISVENTILNCDKLIEFQMIVKVSAKYESAWHGNKKLNEKVLRVFASKSKNDFGVFKVKTNGATKEKIASTPGNCYIDNGDIHNKRISRKLDRNWYINLAKKRIADFEGR